MTTTGQKAEASAPGRATFMSAIRNFGEMAGVPSPAM